MNIISHVYESDHVRLWQEGMNEWNGIAKRIFNDQVEDEHWKNFLNERNFNSNDNESIKMIQTELLKLIRGDESVAEIGSGWGNYSFEVAKKVKKLICIDCSKSIIEYLKGEAERRGFNNIEFVQKKWEYSIFKESYDVVIGINCFSRTHNIVHALWNMNNTAKRLVIAGMSTESELPHYIDLYNELGYNVNFLRKEYIHIINILWELGVYANCKLIPCSKTIKFNNYEDLMRMLTTKILTKDINTKEIEKVILRYVKAKESTYEYTYQYHTALIHWKPQAIRI
ncbi:MAG: class I SAM-dependent methyltransferase [Bacillota bacterium]